MRREKRSLSALIIDDEADSVCLLCTYLEQYGCFEEIIVSNSVEDGLFQLLKHQPDFVFLAIQLPGRSGIDFLEVINQHALHSHFVIVSHTRVYAAQVIKFSVFDYLIKPVNKTELYNIIDKHRLKIITNSLDRLNSRVMEQVGGSVKIKFISRNSFVIVEPMEIVYCQAQGSYTRIFFANKHTEMVCTYLSKVEEVLERFNFMRIGRSSLINLEMLRAINRVKNTCTLAANGQFFEVEGSHSCLKKLDQRVL